MPTKLNILPPRVPIGTFTDQFGKSHDVLPSPELTRSLADLITRVGGPTAFSSDELLALASTDPGDSSALAVLQNKVREQAAELASFAGTAARLAAMERKLEDLARLAHSTGSAPVDWEHPGKIGAASANSGKFTTLEATDLVKLNPKDKPVDIKPTGTALVTIQPAQAGQVDNMELGKTAPQAARVTSLNKVTVTQPATGATLTLADGATLAVPGAGGTLGSAAYESASAFAGRSNTALAAVATDAASTQALANSMRAVLISVGVGT